MMRVIPLAGVDPVIDVALRQPMSDFDMAQAGCDPADRPGGLACRACGGDGAGQEKSSSRS